MTALAAELAVCPRTVLRSELAALLPELTMSTGLTVLTTKGWALRTLASYWGLAKGWALASRRTFFGLGSLAGCRGLSGY